MASPVNVFGSEFQTLLSLETIFHTPYTEHLLVLFDRHLGYSTDSDLTVQADTCYALLFSQKDFHGL